MTHDKITAFAALLRRAAEAGTMQNVTFHSPAAGDALKCRGKLRAIGGQTLVQMETFLTEGRVSQENIAPADLEAAAERLFDTYRKADLTDAGGTASLMVSKKGTVTLLRKGQIGEGYAAGSHPAALPRPGNDRVKRRLLTGEEPFLVPLGISDRTGRIHDKMQPKFRQIARFAEYVAEAEKKLDPDGPLTVCDLCCGKSYLSFAAYYVLTALSGRDVRMFCVDRKASVMETCAGIARASGFGGMEFHAMDIGDFDPGCAPDLVLSLHACDTATDLVLDYASRHRAKIILSTPCCQKELNRALDCPTLGFIASVPVLRRSFAATATDALRLLKLEAEGYRTDATEFVDPEDTPKNVMLRAFLRPDFDPASADAAQKRERYERTRAFLYGDGYRGHELNNF
ncbi:MAG: SAM-dependent methyltransferase [Clostridiales bacterium]|nr:SAM-dependent methyltransferase [Clostridiales bacterium]